ncbi:MAG TPA: hypothetical protein VIL34_07285 [Actinopolymorphaceae bacterium]
MTGTAGHARAVRGRLVRLVAVLAVLAGVALAVGLQCTDGMAMPMAHGASADAAMACSSSPSAMAERHVPERVTSADSGGLTAAACPTPGAAESFVLAENGSPGSGGMGGVLATCLAFILAVVVAVASLRPGPSWGVVRLLRPARAVATRAVQPLAPSLAELCLLRT